MDLDTFRRDLNAELACRAAIKKHHHLPPELAQRLIQDLLACEVPHTCPHGRPVVKKLSRSDLEGASAGKSSPDREYADETATDANARVLE